jgi:hypothetical protein
MDEHCCGSIPDRLRRLKGLGPLGSVERLAGQSAMNEHQQAAVQLGRSKEAAGIFRGKAHLNREVGRFI